MTQRLGLTGVLLVALVGCFALLGTNAFGHELLINGASIATFPDAFLTTFSNRLMLLEDVKGGLFGESVDVLCDGEDEGEIDWFGRYLETILKITKCETDAGICGEPAAEPVNLPWQFELASGTEATIESSGAGSPGWSVVCNKTVEDTCTGTSKVKLENVTEGINELFDATTGEKPFSCTRGGAGTGLIEGEDLMFIPGKTLSVV